MKVRLIHLLGIGTIAATGLVQQAHAKPGGIAGYSGNPAINRGSTCLACHRGGATPTVTLSGPTSVVAGSTNQYILKITGGQNKRGGVDISTTGGSLIAGAGSKILSGEVVQSASKSVTAGAIEFPFSLKAPASAGVVTLHGIGFSSNGSGESGDGEAKITQMITVTDSAPPPMNVPPTANAGGPYSAVLGDPIALDGSLSKDPDGSISSYSWDFGDGAKASGAKVNHSYLSSGNFNVTLTVTDNQGASAQAKVVATVNMPANKVPVANAGGPYRAEIAANVQFDGSASRDPDGSIVSYAWSFGDGAMDSGVKPSHAYSAAGMYPVSLTVTDNNGATAKANSMVTILDQPMPTPTPTMTPAPTPVPTMSPAPEPDPEPTMEPAPIPTKTPKPKPTHRPPPRHGKKPGHKPGHGHGHGHDHHHRKPKKEKPMKEKPKKDHGKKRHHKKKKSHS